MSHDGLFDVKKHVRTYLIVFVSLAFLTIVTVAVSYLHLSTKLAILVALMIATLKGSLVASCFMHLISEKKLIFMVLLITVVFFIFLMFLPVATIQEMAK